MKLRYIAILLILASGFSGFGQEVSLQGRVLDTIRQALEFANILAIPQTEEKSIAFSISDDRGRYKLLLQKNLQYDIEISYLGYEKIIYPIILTKNTNKDFVLTPSSESLEEVVVLEQRMPVVVKEDTITYRTGAFTSGKERKLREVLKKLPGVEVDKEGNVTVNGKKVDKLLVEGRTFFMGSTKLGVNNIPADAVDEVEVLDNYSEIPFLKGLSSSDKMAINIKLKEGKKKFVFGDLEAGVGIKDRHLIHPTLFYYSPKTNVNVIGGINNTGKKSFTFYDYINFEGGLAKLLDNPASYFNLANSDFARSLSNRNFTFSQDQFWAFNIAQQLSPKTRLNAYSIVDPSTTKTRVENTNTYLIEDQIFNVENRTTTTESDNFFSLNKVELNYIPNAKEDISFKTVFKTSKGSSNEQLESLILSGMNSVNTRQEPVSWEIIQNLGYSKQFSSKHTTTLRADFRVTKTNNNSSWLFTEPIFTDIIPVKGEGLSNILQKVESENYNLSLVIKHYWILNDFNHIYPVLGYNFSKQEYNTLDSQLFGEQSISFRDAGFNNATIFRLNDPFVGVKYKAKTGDVTFRTGLVYHLYYWNTKQFDEKQSTISKSQLLPELSIKWDIKNSEKFNFKYNLTSRFNDASFFANRLRLRGFNSLYRGSDELENALTHQASLNYYRFNLLRGLFYNAGINYAKKVRSIRNTTIIEGIDQINSSVYTDFPENTLGINASFSKNINKLKFTLKGNASFSNYSRNINNEIANYQSKMYGYTFKTETSFKNYPNLEMGISQYFSNFSSDSFQNKFIRTKPFALLQYDFLNGFILKADYNYTLYKNKEENTKNIFQIGNASLYYNKEDSPLGFEAEVENIFDVRLKNENSFNQFIITDTRTFIQPRTLVFKLSYKI